MSDPADGASSAQGVVNEECAEIGRLQLDLDALGRAGERPRHYDVVLDMRRQDLEEAALALEPGIERRIDHLLLAGDAGDDLLLAYPLGLLLGDERPVALA